MYIRAHFGRSNNDNIWPEIAIRTSFLKIRSICILRVFDREFLKVVSVIFWHIAIIFPKMEYSNWIWPLFIIFTNGLLNISFLHFLLWSRSNGMWVICLKLMKHIIRTDIGYEVVKTALGEPPISPFLYWIIPEVFRKLTKLNFILWKKSAGFCSCATGGIILKLSMFKISALSILILFCLIKFPSWPPQK